MSVLSSCQFSWLFLDFAVLSKNLTVQVNRICRWDNHNRRKLNFYSVSLSGNNWFKIRVDKVLWAAAGDLMMMIVLNGSQWRLWRGDGEWWQYRGGSSLESLRWVALDWDAAAQDHGDKIWSASRWHKAKCVKRTWNTLPLTTRNMIQRKIKGFLQDRQR